MEVLPAVGGGGVAVAAVIGVGVLGAGAALIGAVPAGEGVGVVVDEDAATAVYPDFVLQDALRLWRKAVVAFGLWGEAVGEEEGDAAEGDAAEGGVEAGGGVGFHEEVDGVGGVGRNLEEGEGVAVGLQFAVDVPVAACPASVGGGAVADAVVFGTKDEVVVVEDGGVDAQSCDNRLDGVDDYGD